MQDLPSRLWFRKKMHLKSALVWSFTKIHGHPRNVKLMPVYSYSPSKTVFFSEMKYTASQFILIH